MERPDTISVTVTHREEIKADKVDLHVTMKGASLFTGTAALKQAKEVSQLVSSLAAVGVAEQDIALEGIHADSSGGILGRSTSASYQLRVRCNELETLADILAVVTSQRHGRLEFLKWRYPDDKSLRGGWLRSCLAEAKEKAGSIASSLGLRLLGVHTLEERWLDSEQGVRAFAPAVGAEGLMLRARAASVDLGFPLSHSKWLEVQVEMRFRVSDLGIQQA